MKTLRTAVVGVGHLGRVHARLLAAVEGVKLVGVVDPSPEARRSAAAQFQCEAFADHRDLPGRIDAAIVAAPTTHHHRVALDLLPRGVHLLVEKPLALTVAEADEMIAAARAGGAVLQVGHVERFNPALTVVEPLVVRPRSIEAVRCFGHSFRSTDIGAVLDLMIHDIDLALSLVREEVVDVQAGGAVVLGPHEDLAEARLTFAGGCVANLRASRLSPDARRTMNIYCDHAHVFLDFAAPSARAVHLRGETQPATADLTGLSPAALTADPLTVAEREALKQRLFNDLLPLEVLPVEPANAILEEQQDFVTSILSSAAPRVSGAQARAALAVAQRVLAEIERNTRAEQRIASPHVAATLTMPTPPPPADSAAPRRKAG